MKKINGVTLFITLIFLQIFSLVGLYVLSNTYLVMKLTRDSWNKKVNLASAEYIRHYLENTINTDDLICRMRTTNASQLALRPLSWWKEHTCSGNFFGIRYYYAFESLGKDSCAVISFFKNNEAIVAHYYRVSLMMLPNPNTGSKIMLQSTFIKGIQEIFSCTEIVHKVKFGHQVGRQLLEF